MWSISSATPVWLYRRPCDMRKSYDGLSALVRREVGANPLDGSVYCFVNRRRTQLKCLYFEGDGFCVWAKRLEQGTYHVRFDGNARARIGAQMLKLIIDGIDPSSVRRFKRYAHVAADAHRVSL